MRPFAAILVLFGISALVLPGLTAQNKDDAKKDAKEVEKKDAKDDKKGEEKKGDDKKGDDQKKTDAPKKSSKKTVDPEEQKILKNSMPRVRARIQNMDPNSSGEFTVQLPFRYAPKQKAAYQWYQQQLQLKSPPYAAMQELQKRLGESNMVEVRTGTGMKVRTMFFPMEYDDKGNLKRPTTKQIAAMKGNSILPGYPAQFEALKTGQIVDIYFAKEPAAKKTPPPRDKKKKVLDDDLDDPLLKPEALMVVVVFEAPQRP